MTTIFDQEWFKQYEGDPPEEAVIRTDIFGERKVKYATLNGVIWVMDIEKLEEKQYEPISKSERFNFIEMELNKKIDATIDLLAEIQNNHSNKIAIYKAAPKMYNMIKKFDHHLDEYENDKNMAVKCIISCFRTFLKEYEIDKIEDIKDE